MTKLVFNITEIEEKTENCRYFLHINGMLIIVIVFDRSFTETVTVVQLTNTLSQCQFLQDIFDFIQRNNMLGIVLE